MSSTNDRAKDRAKRQSIIEACLDINRIGIDQGASGNISLRHGDGMLITPTSTLYETMQLEQIVFMKLDRSPDAEQRPSSEMALPSRYPQGARRGECGGSCAPSLSTILAIMGLEIPPVHYMIACAGGDSIRCAPYATFGTKMSRHAVTALEDRSACLLAHHGMIAVGTSLAKAMWLAVEVETLARQYHGCLQIGTPPQLSKAEIENVRARMARYGIGGDES